MKLVGIDSQDNQIGSKNGYINADNPYVSNSVSVHMNIN